MAPRTISNPAALKLVEQQMRNWEIARNQRRPRETTQSKWVEDFVCISRQIGTDAEDIGAMLGQRLGWPVFDKEILHLMSGDDAILEQLYTSMDERDVGWCEEILRSLMQSESSKNDYFHKLCRTILSIARQGNAIFMGRGADIILPRQHGLRVRIVAPLDARVMRTAQRENLSPGDARRIIETLETERERFIRRYFNAEVNDPGRFDLVINFAGFTLAQTVDLIEAAQRYLASPRLDS